MALSRKHGITTDSYKKLTIDTGAVYKNYGIGGESLLGATRGGNSFTIETEYRDMEMDGAKGKVKGGRRITGVSASITANFVEMSAALFDLIMTGSDTANFPVAPAAKTHDSITRALQIEDGDFATNIAIVGEVSNGLATPIVVLISNAICDGNMEMGFNDDDEAVIPVTFSAHFLPSAMDTEPWEIRWPVIS